MGREKRIAELRRRVPYLLEEGNLDELREIMSELNELGDSASDILSKMTSYEIGDMLYYDEYNKAIDLYNKRNYGEETKKLAKKALEYHPFSYPMIYILAACENGKPFSVIKYDWEESGFTEDDRHDVINRLAESWSVFRDDPKLRHDAFCSVKDYSSARSVYTHEAFDLFRKGNYGKATEYFNKALEFEYADSMPAREEFDKEIGNKRKYLPERVKKECPDEYEQLTELRRVVKAHPSGKGWLPPIVFLISFAFSVVLAFLPNSILAMVGFALFFALGVRFIGEKKTVMKSILSVLGITALAFFFGTLSITMKDMFFNLSPLLQKFPDSILLNILSLLPGLVHLFRQIKGLPGEKARKDIHELKKVFEAKADEIKKELYDRYSKKASGSIVEFWVKELSLFDL